MSNSFNNIVIYNGYPLSVIVAVSFHFLLLAGLLYLQSSRSPEALELVRPSVVKALLIDENPQVKNQQNAERQRLERIEQQRISREQTREQERRQAEAEKQRQEQAAAAEAVAKQQLERDRSALVERERLEKLQAEKLRQEQLSEAERQRQRALAEAERVRQQQAEARQQEQAQASQAEAARTEFELVQSATALIQQVVQENWSRPPSARNGMRAILQIRMLPTGELVEATITRSSGDAAFDRSAETAVHRAAPFRELAGLPITIFNANFRTLSLIFEPEDLLN